VFIVPPEYSVEYVLVDANFVTWRDFHQTGLAKMRHPVTGQLTGVSFGFLRAMRQWIQQFRPKKAAVVWDSGVAEWRKEMIPGYKDRSEQKKKLDPVLLDAMMMQRDWLHSNLRHFGIRSLRIPGTEADDVIALLAESLSSKGRVVIITGDYDFNQLASDKIHVYQSRQNELITDSMKSSSSLLGKCILGDSSDKIPGIPKVGEKTLEAVVKRIEEAGKGVNWPNIVECARQIKGKRFEALTTLEAGQIVERNMRLIDLREGARRLPMDLMMQALQEAVEPVSVNVRNFGKLAHEMSFQSVLDYISDWERDFSALS
jgi:5'-3' exonuclease